MRLHVEVKKSFADFTLQTSFTLQEKRSGIFGHSGSGKTTLLHMIAGLLSPDQGHIILNNRPLFDHQAGINIPPEQRRIGLVFQQGVLFPHLNVQANLRYGWQRTSTRQRHIPEEEIINALHLRPLLTRQTTSLSGGERQRVALGRTLLSCPQLIIMDEPLSGLDETIKQQIIPDLQKIFRQFAIPTIFTSHSQAEMREMTEELLVMAEGHIQQQLASKNLAQTAASW